MRNEIRRNETTPVVYLLTVSQKNGTEKNDERQNKACQRSKKWQSKSLLLVRLSKKLGKMWLGEMLPNRNFSPYCLFKTCPNWSIATSTSCSVAVDRGHVTTLSCICGWAAEDRLPGSTTRCDVVILGGVPRPCGHRPVLNLMQIVIHGWANFWDKKCENKIRIQTPARQPSTMWQITSGTGRLSFM